MNLPCMLLYHISSKSDHIPQAPADFNYVIFVLFICYIFHGSTKFVSGKPSHKIEKYEVVSKIFYHNI